MLSRRGFWLGGARARATNEPARAAGRRPARTCASTTGTNRCETARGRVFPPPPPQPSPRSASAADASRPRRCRSPRSLGGRRLAKDWRRARRARATSSSVSFFFFRRSRTAAVPNGLSVAPPRASRSSWSASCGLRAHASSSRSRSITTSRPLDVRAARRCCAGATAADASARAWCSTRARREEEDEQVHLVQHRRRDRNGSASSSHAFVIVPGGGKPSPRRATESPAPVRGTHECQTVRGRYASFVIPDVRCAPQVSSSTRGLHLPPTSTAPNMKPTRIHHIKLLRVGGRLQNGRLLRAVAASASASAPPSRSTRTRQREEDEREHAHESVCVNTPGRHRGCGSPGGARDRTGSPSSPRRAVSCAQRGHWWMDL